MTDNTQELDEILLRFSSEQFDASYEANDKLMIDSHKQAKQSILDWHNKQIEEVLDRLDKRIDYNKHDMGELGEFIRIKYAHNFIEAERNKPKESK